MPAVHLKPGEQAHVGADVKIRMGRDGPRAGVTLHVGCGDAPVLIEAVDGSLRPLSRTQTLGRMSTAAVVKGFRGLRR